MRPLSTPHVLRGTTRLDTTRLGTTRLGTLLGVTLLAGLVGAGCGAKSALERPEIDAGRPDAFVVPDGFTPPDAAPACRTDGDCDDGLACSDDRCVSGNCEHQYVSDRCNDGLFCNGLEQCRPGLGCVSPGRTCDDGIACTRDVCDDGRGMCLFETDDTACPVSFRCDAMRGCLARALAHDATTLFEVDLPSGETRRIGAFPISLNDIALAADGTFYGASTDVGALVRVDYVSMSYELVVPVRGSFNALDVAPDGRLYGAADDRIFVFDTALGTATEVARLPTGLSSSGDLAFVEGRLFITAYRAFTDVSDWLVEIDLASGAGAVVGELGFDCVWALAPLGPALYGLTCEGQILEIELATARTRSLAFMPGRAFWGAASR